MVLSYGQRHVDYSIYILGIAIFALASVRPLYPIAIAILLWLLALFLVTPEMLSHLSAAASGLRAT